MRWHPYVCDVFPLPAYSFFICFFLIDFPQTASHNRQRYQQHLFILILSKEITKTSKVKTA